ncbi:MAG: hypothetical protein OXT06_16235 [Rhodospirillaceae bacterium]|nr:hypothetical protein [Rhodospirillaceae bacterium]MDD9916979.1 hypothetical protein [Rhodospirillaceae bacterium]MDD9929518.1 hypothetical protein [Rhodospirillaceae bacterium]
MRNLLKWSAVPALGLALAAPFGASAAEPTVVTLTQVACQFVESENGVDHKYKSTQKADCEAINAKSGADRLAKAAPIKLKAGKYIFRVTNKNVPYTLGFWIRDKDYDWRNPLHKLNKTSVSGGGMTLGKTLDYEVELKPGQYVYSCPLNTTPDYTLIVEG